MPLPPYRIILFFLCCIAVLLWLAFTAPPTTAPPVTQKAEQFFAKGNYQQALLAYTQLLQQDKKNVAAWRGKALSLFQLKQHQKALAAFNQAISLDPSFAGTYANRGIVHDYQGNYQQALADYEEALRRDPRISRSPSWWQRFLYLQADTPSTIAKRAAYLKVELAKPASERLLRMPEKDAQQQPFQQKIQP